MEKKEEGGVEREMGRTWNAGGGEKECIRGNRSKGRKRKDGVSTGKGGMKSRNIGGRKRRNICRSE